MTFISNVVLLLRTGRDSHNSTMHPENGRVCADQERGILIKTKISNKDGFNLPNNYQPAPEIPLIKLIEFVLNQPLKK
jgi:hypothetical protein